MLIAKPTSYNNVIHHSHFPRDAMTHIHGLHHTIIVVIAVSASVGGVLVTFLFWRCLSRNARRAPLPPRQALVHQREQQLAAFTGHRGIIIPGDVLDSLSPVSVCHGSDASLIPHVNSSANTLRTSLHTHETEDGPESQSISYQNPLHPTPHLSVPHSPLNASSASLPSSNNHSLSATGSTTASPSQSIRRTHPRPRPRPFSIVSNGTSHTTMTARSRSSTRGAPHAPHNNVQIILPAPLAPNLYPSANGDNWRRGLADKWIPVGQHSIPEPKSVKPQRSRSMERRGRQAQNKASQGSIPRRRSNSNPPPHSRLRHSSRHSLDSSLDTPPVPRVPSAYGALLRQDAPVLLTASGSEVPSSPPSAFPGSSMLRS